MPMHDWTRVEAGIYHAFHHSWIEELSRSLNAGLLPPDFYALPEQAAAGHIADILTLEVQRPVDENGANGHGVATASAVQVRPRARFVAKTGKTFLNLKKSAIAVRHVTRDDLVALIEILSPGNKSSRKALRAFVKKACELLAERIHLLIVDPFPPGRLDPNGIHQAIWSEVQDDDFSLPPDEPLTLVSYECEAYTRAYIEPFRVGAVLPDMALFLDADACVKVPLEATYQAAYAVLPKRWQTVLDAPAV